MIARLSTLVFSLLVCSLVVSLGGSAFALTAEPPAEMPARWMGQGSGNDLLWLPGRDRSRVADFGLLERAVQVDGQTLRVVTPGGTGDWVGTLDTRETPHWSFWSRRARPAAHTGEKKYAVGFDDPSVAAIEAFLAERIAASSMREPVDARDLDVSVYWYRVDLVANAAEASFDLSGRLVFRVARPGDQRGRFGAYRFALSGAIEPQPDEVPPPPAGPVRVLLLGDSRSQVQIEQALLAAGYEVTTLARYADWDGVTPDVNDHDVAIHLSGFDFAPALAPAADAALSAFVASGGGLIRTEWSLWSGLVNPLTDPLLPLVYQGAYRTGTTWTVTMPGDPLVAGVAASWFDPASYSLGAPVPGATVAMASPAGDPLVSYRTDTGGTVVHINHALTYASPNLDPNVIQLFVNGAAFAAGR